MDGVSFKIPYGKTFGLVGESGCGKTTIGRTIMRMYEATDGDILFKGDNVLKYDSKKAKKYTKNVQMIFQDPYASLDPTMSVGRIIGEGMEIHGMYCKNECRDRVAELLCKVGLSPEHVSRFPHEFSGGQRQRIGIARALALEPEFIVCDEPISALDVSIQGQVVNLLQDLQKELGLSYLFIAHNLSMVKYISNTVAVMYLGKIVECTGSKSLYDNPLHPYTQALLSAIPIPDPKINSSRKRIILEGDVPSPIGETKGCRFRTRCPCAMPICSDISPEQKEVAPEHFVACHKY